MTAINIFIRIMATVFILGINLGIAVPIMFAFSFPFIGVFYVMGTFLVVWWIIKPVIKYVNNELI